MVLSVEEAVSPAGEVLQAPEDRAVLASGQTLIDRGARCLVVAFANSEHNPANEQRARQVIQREYPRDYLGSVPVFLSSNISPRSGDAARINAAVINAYIHARLFRLVYKAGEDLRQRLYWKSLFIGHNNGAVARGAKTRAIHTYNSGPAAGLLGARRIARVAGLPKMIITPFSAVFSAFGSSSMDVGHLYYRRAEVPVGPGRGLTALAAAGQAGDAGLVVTMVGLRTQAPVPHYDILATPQTSGDAFQARKGIRPVFMEASQGPQEIPIYEMSRLGPGHQIRGPAVVESQDTTLLLQAGWQLRVDAYRNCILEGLIKLGVRG